MSLHQIKFDIFNEAELYPPPTWAMLVQADIESSYNPAAHNAITGAAGLFQIELATALQPGYDVQPIRDQDRYYTIVATRFACQLLTGFYNDPHVANHSWAMAFLFYNVGPDADPATASPLYKKLAALVAHIEGEEYTIS